MLINVSTRRRLQGRLCSAAREGDPARIAASGRVGSSLGWQPHFDDLSTIIAHALDWVRELMARRYEARL